MKYFTLGGGLFIQRKDCNIFREMQEGTLKKSNFPMDTVIELPETAKECGLTVEDYDYLNMPEKEDDTLTITVTIDETENEGKKKLNVQILQK